MATTEQFIALVYFAPFDFSKLLTKLQVLQLSVLVLNLDWVLEFGEGVPPQRVDTCRQVGDVGFEDWEVLTSRCIPAMQVSLHRAINGTF